MDLVAANLDLGIHTRTHTAVSTKVVPEKRKSVRDNADWYCLALIQ